MINKALMFTMYERMLRIRRFEEKVADLYARGLVPGLPHLYIGQEAVAVGVCMNLRKEDYILSNHRGHGHSIAKGVPADLLMAEILGKATGCCKGRGGSMRLAYVKAGVLYSSPIVGSNMALATGVGLSIKLCGTDKIVVCFFGEGAANTGTFHESLNLASLWGLPVLYVCENNQFAVSTHISRSTSVESIAHRAVAYSMPGLVVNGNDVTAVYESALETIERVRNGTGPTLIEYKTYRWMGHHAGDPVTGRGDKSYRSLEDVKEAKKKCPIKYIKARLLKAGVGAEELRTIEAKVDREIEDALTFAQHSPYPEPRGVREFCFAGEGAA